MPTVLPKGLVIDCHLPREDPRDAFVSKSAATLAALPEGAVVGTSSVRRRAILLNHRPDLKLVEFRGNVGTRLDKLARGEAAATILALAGLKRLGAEAHARHIFTRQEMLPAVAQGTIGVEAREADTRLRDLILPIDDRDTALAVTLERAFLAVLDGSCKTPISGLAERCAANAFEFSGCVLTPDGRTRHDVSRTAALATLDEARAVGADAGQDLLSRAGRRFFEV
jgi:hydroxymethylbilane synthase